MTTLGVHCGMIVRPDSILAATDRDGKPGSCEVVNIHPTDSLHSMVAGALRRFLPLGGRAVLISNDADTNRLCLDLPDGTAFLDPQLLGDASGTGVELATAHQALATVVRRGGTASYELTGHPFKTTQPFGLVMITEEAATARLNLGVVGTNGIATAAETSAPASVSLNRTGLVVLELLSRLTREVPEGWPQIGICLMTQSGAFGRTLAGYFESRLNSTPYPVRLMADPYALLSGALMLAQHPLKV